MNRIVVKGAGKDSRILIGERLENLKSYLPETQVIIITDENVASLYEDRFPPLDRIVIAVGETVKTLKTVEDIYERLIAAEAQRSCMIVGIGGGVVCDITGFAASTYLRGVSFGFVASTLLAQVDASVGGKNGVNFKGYKNMVGVFNQPEFVICDSHLLKTLPEKEVYSGFGEIVKHAVIGDAATFEYLEKNAQNVLALRPDIIEKIVHDSVLVKAGVVTRDEKEQGERRKLNFGHTFGHAVEKLSGMPHGMAVSIGMALAADISVKKGMLAENKASRLKRLLEALQLPIHFDMDHKAFLDAVGKDKKREGDHIHFVLLEDIGKAVVEEVSMDELAQVLVER